MDTFLSRVRIPQFAKELYWNLKLICPTGTLKQTIEINHLKINVIETNGVENLSRRQEAVIAAMGEPTPY